MGSRGGASGGAGGGGISTRLTQNQALELIANEPGLKVSTFEIDEDRVTGNVGSLDYIDKPTGGILWLADADVRGNKITTPWTQFVEDNSFGRGDNNWANRVMPRNQRFTLLRENPNANILEASTADYDDLLNRFPSTNVFGERSINWNRVAQEYDGFRLTDFPSGWLSGSFGGWDFPQTVYFNNNAFQILGSIPNQRFR